jgi:hypothetical protein
MGYHDIHDLEIRYGGEDEDDARDYCDDRDHFTDLTDYVTQKLGYFGIKWSVVHDNYYGDDWEYFQCPEIGRQGKKPLVALLEEDNEIEYLRPTTLKYVHILLVSVTTFSTNTRS